MALIKLDIDEDTAREQRAKLWRKRLALEVKCARRTRAYPLRNPGKDSPKVAAFRTLLRFVGLYERGAKNALSPVLRQFELGFNTLPVAFNGFRILHLTDFHFKNRPGFLESVCGLIDGVHADICLLTGDYHYNKAYPCRLLYGEIHGMLKHIHARLGTFAILGNNDSSNFVEAFRALGIETLVNRNVLLSQGEQKIALAGVDDPHEFFCDGLDAALAGTPQNTFTILLAHSPEIIQQAAAKGIDLYLCGHTHGGQICLPGVGPILTNARCSRQYVSGFWRYGEMQGYTSRGIGTAALPVRFACPPEAALITLKRA